MLIQVSFRAKLFELVIDDVYATKSNFRISFHYEVIKANPVSILKMKLTGCSRLHFGSPTSGCEAAEKPKEQDMNARSTWEMPTPWGYATYMNEVAEGIVIYETDERGGIHLSDSRNERIPDAVKQMTQKGVDGWYDNDGEARVVRMFYPEYFPLSNQKHTDLSFA